jgi:hypothetical protein
MKSEDPKSLVVLTECGSNVEASILRASLESRGIYCYVQGENHRSMLGTIAGNYVALNLMVRREDLEVARELLVEQRRDAEASLAAETGFSDEDEDEEDEAAPAKDPRTSTDDLQRKRRLKVARLAAVIPGFGCGHHSAGAHLRGFLLGATEILGLVLAFSGRNGPLGASLFAFARVGDFFFVGSSIPASAPLPRAKLR